MRSVPVPLMDTPASPPPPPLPSTTSKLRLLCSYGGHITPRPNSKTLFYLGGDTRIVAVDRHTTSLCSFTSHLSTTLLINQPFLVKYQLPNQDYDALISIATDEDLLIMFEEHERLANLPIPSRLRLFIFPLKQPAVVRDSPPDSWFNDALRSAEIMRRKSDSYEDFASVESRNENLVMPDSIVLETSSSFGSTSSSASSSNLPSTGFLVEDNAVNLQDNKVALPFPGPVFSTRNLANGISCTMAGSGINQDSVLNLASMESGIASARIESERGIPNAFTTQGYKTNKTVQVSGYPITAPLAHHHHQQQLQFVQSGSHYIPNSSTNTLPISSNIPVFNPQLHHQVPHYQSAQPYPVYLLPASQTQPYNLAAKNNLIDSGTVAPSRPLVHPNVARIPQQLAYKEVTAIPPVPELAMKVYATTLGTNPVVNVTPTTQNQQEIASFQHLHQPCQSVAVSLMEAENNCNKLDDDDPAYSLIYKTQPTAPTLLSQFQTMTPLLLSEDFAKLQLNDAGQHRRI